VVQNSGTPYFCFKDIDENKPTGSIRIRVETIGYFLKRYREDMIKNKGKKKTLEERLAEDERVLRAQLEAEECELAVRGAGIPLPVLSVNVPVDQRVGASGD